MKKLSACWIVMVFFLLVALPSLADAAARTALVIGNSSYKSAPLKNPANDAQDMADTLRDLDFDVIEKIDADKRAMVKAVNTFGKKLHKSDVGIFFYAGHGMQIQGRNFLIPVGARVKSESDVEFEGVHAGRILGKMEEADNKLNIVILDACRDNPFKRNFRSSRKGLARMDAPIGSIIAYATSPGSVAADGTGENGVYTKHLLDHIKEAGLDVREVFNRTGLDVMEETGRKQVPWTSNTPVEPYFLAGGDAVVMQPSEGGRGTGDLKIRTTPTDAKVFIDRRFQGNAPKDLYGLKAGSHTIRAEKDGYVSEKKQVRVKPGRVTKMRLYMNKEKLDTGRLFVNTQPSGAKVRLLNLDREYEYGMELKAGDYQIEVSKVGYEKTSQWVNLSREEDLKTTITLKKAGPAESKKFKTAIFPMRFKGKLANNINEDKERKKKVINITMKGIIGSLSNFQKEIVLQYSHYHIKNNEYGGDIKFSKEYMKKKGLLNWPYSNLWKRKTWFSELKLDIIEICNIGKKIQADLVLMYKLYIAPTHGTDSLVCYIIDINRKKLYSTKFETHSLQFGGGKGEIQQYTTKIIKKYFAQRKGRVARDVQRRLTKN